MFDVRFDRIVSIGDSCGCAMILREARLRTASGPLDWLTGAAFEQRIRTLCSRFGDFLHRENIVWHESGAGDRANDVYRDQTTGDRFVHDFPKNMALQDSFPRVREKYDRRIQRLLKALDEGESVCFVWRHLDGFELADETCLWAADRLREAFPKASCRLLVFENDKELSEGAIEIRTLAAGRCVKVKGPFLRPGDDALTGNFELQRRVLKRLRLSAALAWKCRKEAFQRSLVRFLSLWHTSRETRKLSRERWERRLCRRSGAPSVGW